MLNNESDCQWSKHDNWSLDSGHFIILGRSVREYHSSIVGADFAQYPVCYLAWSLRSLVEMAL